MSMKPIVIASLMILASSSLQAAGTAKAPELIAVKQISSISNDKNHRQIRIRTSANLYVVAFDKPCSALKRSDVSLDPQADEYLRIGTELKVGKDSCVIKRISRDLDLPAISTARDEKDPRQVLAGPRESRQAR